MKSRRAMIAVMMSLAVALPLALTGAGAAPRVTVGLSISTLNNPFFAAAALLAGLTDVDAITLALARAAAQGSMPASTAAGTIALAVCANTVAKGVYAASFGTPAYRRASFTMLGAALIAGIAVLSAGALRP